MAETMRLACLVSACMCVQDSGREGHTFPLSTRGNKSKEVADKYSLCIKREAGRRAESQYT